MKPDLAEQLRWAHSEIADLKLEVRAKQAVLRAVEWVRYDDGVYCSYCRGRHPDGAASGGHHPDCALMHEVQLHWEGK